MDKSRTCDYSLNSASSPATESCSVQQKSPIRQTRLFFIAEKAHKVGHVKGRQPARDISKIAKDLATAVQVFQRETGRKQNPRIVPCW